MRTTRLERAPGEERSVALAFVNTLFAGPGGTVDGIGTAPRLEEWLAGRGLAPRAGSLGSAAVREAQRLRGALCKLLVAAASGDPPDPRALELVNRAAARAPAVRELRFEPPAGFRAETRRSGRSQLALALGSIAADAIELLASERAQALRACPAPGCVRLLLADRPRRRWCSTRCGDRVRAARHYRRRRETGSGPRARDGA